VARVSPGRGVTLAGDACRHIDPKLPVHLPILIANL